MEKAGSQSTTSHVVGCKPLTTFVQTDATTFREVVQRLTGPSESRTLPSKALGSKRPTTTSKLHERRHLTRPKLQIVKPSPNSHFSKPTTSISAEHPSCISSPLGTPSKILSMLSIGDGEKELNNMEEEKAIKERRFYLHPSPRSIMPGYAQPELLSLFPLESPKSSSRKT